MLLIKTFLAMKDNLPSLNCSTTTNFNGQWKVIFPNEALAYYINALLYKHKKPSLLFSCPLLPNQQSTLSHFVIVDVDMVALIRRVQPCPSFPP